MGNRLRLTAACLALLAGLSVLAYQHNPLVGAAQRHAALTAKVSAATYVSLRAVNAFLSTAQEVELGGSLVVSGTMQPLKMLEPIDDTVERIAGLIFGLMVASGILAVAMAPAGALGWALVAIAAVAWVVAPQRPLAGLTRPLAAYGLFLGLALPLAFVLSAGLATPMTEPLYDRHSRIVTDLTEGIEPQEIGAEDSIWRDIDRYRTMAGNLYRHADTLIGSYITILAVFVFRLLVFPLLLLGLFYMIARHVAHGSPARP